MCNGYVEGDRIKNLLPSREGERVEDSKGFPAPNRLYEKSRCENRSGDEIVTIGIKYPSEAIKKSEVLDRSGRKASLGATYGEMDNSGSVEIYVPCPRKKYAEALLSVGVSADSADREYAPAKTVDRATQVLADLTAQATRALSQKHFKCDGAKDLPKGSLHISPALDSKP